MLNRDHIDISRFFSKIEKVGECWEWKASTKNGYGQFVVDHHPYRAHRIMWILVNGDIPSGLQINHTCDNRACVNPKHLWLGTQEENMQDMVKKGRSGYKSGSNGVILRGKDSPYYGEKSVMAKLTWNKVRTIRLLYAEGLYSSRVLARMFGVGHTNILRIVHKITWVE